MELISLHNITTRQKKGGERITIPANTRFNTDDYPSISENEWDAMKGGEPPVVRTPDDPAYITPTVQAQREAATAPVQEGRSPRTDMGAAEVRGGVTVPTNATEDDDNEDDDEKTDDPAPRGRRGRRRAAAEDDDEV